jgi:calcium-dependent protein kinase
MEKITTFNEKYEYIDNDPINSGAFGFIYRIRDKKEKKEYILKKLRKKDPYNPEIKGTDENSFQNEKNFLINVKGTNIINYYYSDEDEKYYYLILEKMYGDLNKMLKKYKNGMPSKLIRKIFSQINAGLKIMIENSKTHRDLKPSNILYSFTNENETDFIVKIGDFGLSTDLYETKTASNTGTDMFKAPEIEEGKYSNKCDLYSIGIILYMLKTGEYIFDGKTKFEILKNKYSNNIKKETDDPKLNNLIKKLVVIDPHERMEWEDYFKDPFFNVDDKDDIKENIECKNTYLKAVKKLNEEKNSYLNRKIIISNNRNY